MMIFRYLFFIIALGLVAIPAFAQKIYVDLQISTKATNKNTNFPVKIVLTNRSAEELNTSKFGAFAVELFECSNLKSYYSIKPTAEIKNKILKKDEFIEFEMNLADLRWNDGSSSFASSYGEKKLTEILGSENKNFSVKVSVFDKQQTDVSEVYLNEKNPVKLTNFTSYSSNEITLSFN